MKKIINNLIEYSTQQFHFVFLICMAVFLSICISINYYFDFEHKVLDTITQSWLQVSSYFLFYALAYFPVFIGYCYFFNKQNLLKNYTFWLSSAVGILTLSINSSMHFQYWMAKFIVSADLTYWVAKCLRNLFSSLQIFTCLYLFWFFYDIKKDVVCPPVSQKSCASFLSFRPRTNFSEDECLPAQSCCFATAIAGRNPSCPGL